MSKYHDWLLNHIKTHPEFVKPEQYRTEMLSRLENDRIRDLSISRTTFTWGVPVPGDHEHVMYVWFDALTNYYSAVKGTDYWPASAHVIGRDIMWFHAVIWPCMLHSAGLPLPGCVLVHGFVNDAQNKKMSKSLGNVVDPHTLLDKYPVDSVRWYVSSTTPYGDDLKFQDQALCYSHNADLCDVLGNLINRAVTLSAGAVPKAGEFSRPFDTKELLSKVDHAMLQGQVSVGAELVAQACKDTNKWLADAEPWKMKGDPVGKAACVRVLLESVYVLAHLYAPYIPLASAAVFKKLGTTARCLTALGDMNLTEGTRVESSTVLFKHLDVVGAEPAPPAPKEPVEKQVKQVAKPAAKGGKAQPEAFDKDQELFSRLDLRVGRILEVTPHPTADRLYVEKIDVGEPEPRQVVSGLREHYSLEELQGRLLVVVCNLKPRKMLQVESSGMVLCAKNSEKVELLTPPDVSPGSKVMLEGSAPRDPWPMNQVDKQKVWDEVAKGLKVDAHGVAMYDGVRLLVKGEALTAPSVTDSIIS